MFLVSLFHGYLLSKSLQFSNQNMDNEASEFFCKSEPRVVSIRQLSPHFISTQYICERALFFFRVKMFHFLDDRYESPYWRNIAASCIQVAWRYRRKRLSRADTSQSNKSPSKWTFFFFFLCFYLLYNCPCLSSPIDEAKELFSCLNSESPWLIVKWKLLPRYTHVIYL